MVLEENTDSADVFWPGYVDAVTNLVLNLLFMLTIMIVAVFMFALELSRHKNQIPAPIVTTTNTELKLAGDTSEVFTQNLKEKDEKIVALEQQVDALRKQVASKNLPVVNKNNQEPKQKIVIVKTPLTEADKGFGDSSSSGGGVVVHFLHEAVTLTESETAAVQKALAEIASRGGARIIVDVPAGFTEAKRLGYYRAMAVRNQLISLKVPAEKIDVSVREGLSSADNTKVLVMEP